MHETLSAIFLICFLLGAVLTALSLLTGAAHLPLPGAHALHLGHLGHAGQLGHAAPIAHAPATGAPPGHAVASHEGASPLNAGSLLAFLTCFGGAGYILLNNTGLGLVLAAAVALLAGLAGGVLIVAFMLLVLIPAQTVVDPEDYRMDGTSARVTAGIPRDGTGEIIYSKAGTRRSDAARSVDGEPIARDQEVVVLSFQRGIAYVQRLERYLNSSAADVAERLAAVNEGRPLPPSVVPVEPPSPDTGTRAEVRDP